MLVRRKSSDGFDANFLPQIDLDLSKQRSCLDFFLPQISLIFADKTQQNLQTASLFDHLRKSAKSAGENSQMSRQSFQAIHLSENRL